MSRVGRGRAAGHAHVNRAALRDRREYSHVVRAALALASQILLVVAVTVRGAAYWPWQRTTSRSGAIACAIGSLLRRMLTTS